jgi:hypothetical protein
MRKTSYQGRIFLTRIEASRFNLPIEDEHDDDLDLSRRRVRKEHPLTEVSKGSKDSAIRNPRSAFLIRCRREPSRRHPLLRQGKVDRNAASAEFQPKP